MESKCQKRMNRGTKRKERLALRDLLHPAIPSSSHVGEQQEKVKQTSSLYDCVLVDADCTHDGSMRHMEKVAGLKEDMFVVLDVVFFF